MQWSVGDGNLPATSLKCPRFVFAQFNFETEGEAWSETLVFGLRKPCLIFFTLHHSLIGHKSLPTPISSSMRPLLDDWAARLCLAHLFCYQKSKIQTPITHWYEGLAYNALFFPPACRCALGWSPACSVKKKEKTPSNFVPFGGCWLCNKSEYLQQGLNIFAARMFVHPGGQVLFAIYEAAATC